MFNLAFYSDQVIPENEAVDRELLAIFESRGLGRRIGYIPRGRSRITASSESDPRTMHGWRGADIVRLARIL